MIVYQEDKSTFMRQVRESKIDQVIYANFKDRLGRKTSNSEQRSWRNSMQYMRNVLDDDAIPNDAKISIECQVPSTSKRIDFIITGQNAEGRDAAVIVELKQWEGASKTNMDGVVRTYTGHGMRDVSHPSYQAWSYAALLEGFNEEVYTKNILVKPCAYLHNCRIPGDLTNSFYKEHLDKAPLFIDSDVAKLADFIKQHVKFGDKSNVMYRIEHGKIRPSKTIADQIVKMVEGNQEFVMIDDQKIAFEYAIKLSNLATAESKKVFIVRGGPGTGKSVVAVQLLARLTHDKKLAQYISKNSAPRDVYASKLAGIKAKTWVNNLFKGSGSYMNAAANEFDTLIVDEAHRLNEKSGLYSNLGENQIKEIINASKCSVFFVDEDQRVTMKDIGSKEEVEKWANFYNAEVHYWELESQFRCNGSDAYIAWLDNFLNIRNTANVELDNSVYDFRSFDSIQEMKQAVLEKNSINNRARLVAGYCWPWNSKKNRNAMDIVIPEENFGMQWNLVEDGSLWIIREDSVNQIGCIHTCQGLEVDYIGVIIGPDLVIRNGQWICQPEKRAKSDKSIHGWKSMASKDAIKAKQMTDLIIKNTYRTLMTRGMKGCYIYSADKETREWLKNLKN